MSQNDKQISVQVTSQLVDYITGLSFEAIPPEVVLKTKQHILDTYGAMVSATQLELGKIIVEFVRQQGGKPEATVVANNFKTSCINAALANGTLGHGDETDDSHYSSITHPGCVVIAAALAAGERSSVNGKTFIAAVGIGYDLLCRMSKTLGPHNVRNSHRNPLNICGCYGAAAAAGKVLGLNKEQMTSALSLAGSQASGLLTWRTEKEHMLKSFEIGVAARNGTTAALLAQQGYRTPPDVFENRHSILQAFGAGQNAAELINELGSRYEIMDTSIKKYPVGQPIQGPAGGLLQIINENNLDAKDIEKITVWLAEYAAALVNNRDIPEICLQYIMAITAYDRKLGFEQAHSLVKFSDPKIQDLRQRVVLIGDPELGKNFPKVRSSVIEVVSRKGETHSLRIEHVPGSPQNPMSQAEVENKFIELSEPILGKDEAYRMVQAIGELEKVKDISEIIR